MRTIGTVRTYFDKQGAKGMGEAFTTELAAAFGDLVLAQAKHNVAPGVGPGPHPHIDRVDTGTLMRGIKAEITKRSNGVTVMVFTDVPYGLYLEAGWHALNGVFYRYPWLLPAINAAQREFSQLVRSKSDVGFNPGSLSRGTTIRKGSNPWETQTTRTNLVKVARRR